ncbi:hypothetical protein BC30048_4432 [Bacillus cereus]|uniref:hypothetical protein n=1 Tax=Bacillus cereus group TaxID=86661 RepID=UPI000789CCDD|nr:MULTISPECIES: hypothetical protein [Bacillus cereus group]KYQ00968.1 hypothetical protein B4079_3885 [Bacillus cereus]MED1214292.1 hypothetical protein [Bacillus paranthracis]BCC14007.1 hypothetical protein BCM0074_4390 [Bacillus cereus]BCD01530.1 hypothetical protein BC30048_4432 [Bacillus cereus]HDR6306054.1 hypothetical protein [Bacillus cereus]
MRNAYIINTNLTHNQNCEQQMLQQEKCAAYYSPWKHYISLIRPNDLVFLYSNGKGIIARGVATGIVETADYENNTEEEHYMKLSSFVQLDTSMEAAVITQTLREIDSDFSIKFNQTMIALPDLFASHLWRRITKEYINPSRPQAHSL